MANDIVTILPPCQRSYERGLAPRCRKWLRRIAGGSLLKATKDTVDHLHIVSFVALSGGIALQRIRYKACALIERIGEAWQRHEPMRSYSDQIGKRFFWVGGRLGCVGWLGGAGKAGYEILVAEWERQLS